MLSIFGPEPPPSNPKMGPITRASRSKAPRRTAEVIDLAARQTAQTALTASAELAERMASYGLQADFELVATATKKLGDDAERDRAASDMRYSAHAEEIDGLRRYAFALAARANTLTIGLSVALVWVAALTTILLLARFA